MNILPQGVYMITYKIDVLEALKRAGYSTYLIRKEKIFAENTLQSFRSKKLVSLNVYDKVCELTGLQIGDILQYEKG